MSNQINQDLFAVFIIYSITMSVYTFFIFHNIFYVPAIFIIIYTSNLFVLMYVARSMSTCFLPTHQQWSKQS